jgi:hypothetical protein
MDAPVSRYTPEEIDAIAGWLKEGGSAGQIAARFSRAFRPVSRSAVIGIVHRNKELSAIGFRSGGALRKPRGERKRPVGPGCLPPKLFVQAVGDTHWESRMALGLDALAPRREARRRHYVRTVDDMIAARNAPIPPGAPPGGATLADCPPRGCRFPVGERATDRGRVTTFCTVNAEAWAPGTSSGCYCNFHRAYLSGCASVTEDAA